MKMALCRMGAWRGWGGDGAPGAVSRRRCGDGSQCGVVQCLDDADSYLRLDQVLPVTAL